MGSALEKFFFCTLERNGKGERADVDVPVCPFGTGRSEGSVLDGDYASYCFDSQYDQLYPNNSMPVTTVHSNSPSSPSHDDMLAPSTQQNWSEGDFLTSQQNWSMIYQSGSNVYIPAQTLYHPAYTIDEVVKSRGTGTYIPDLVCCVFYQTQSIYIMIAHSIQYIVYDPKMVESCRTITPTGIYAQMRTGQGKFPL